MIRKFFNIFLNSLPIVLMLILIRLVSNDYILTLIYISLIAISLRIYRERKDLLVLFVGFISMTFFEYMFVSTGVEKFTRNTLLGVMPVWLPFLWAYGFVVIKRSVKILER